MTADAAVTEEAHAVEVAGGATRSSPGPAITRGSLC
jgi:hypothetical protein